MFEAWPFIASSMELSRISQTRWWSPGDPTPPMYIPGRFRTGSRPSRTVMSFAVYEAAISYEFPMLSASASLFLDREERRAPPFRWLAAVAERVVLRVPAGDAALVVRGRRVFARPSSS